MSVYKELVGPNTPLGSPVQIIDMSSFAMLSLLCVLLLTVSKVQGSCPAADIPTVDHAVHNGGTGLVDAGHVVQYTCINDSDVTYKYVVRVANVVAIVCTTAGTFTEGSLPQCVASGQNVGSGTGCESSGMCCTGQNNACYTQAGCYCDQKCYVFGDCCSDYQSYCTGSGVECPSSVLPTVSHANHNIKSSYNQGDVVTFTCHTNYVLKVGYQNTQTCSASGSFTGTVPVCLHVCPVGTVPTVPHSTNNGDGTYKDGDVVTFQCNPGYLLYYGSPSAITCLSTGVFSGTPACFKTINTQCYPNGTIIVENPDSAIYVSAHAADYADSCTTSWVNAVNVAKKWLAITGCDKDSIITVSFSSRLDDTDEIYGGAKVASYVVKCDEIDATGAVQTVTQGLAPHLSTASEVPVAPTVQISSSFRLHSPTGDPQVTATVGDELYWTLDIAMDYTVTIESCTAYAGTSMAGTPTKLLLEYGCTADADLVESFSDIKVVTTIPHIRRYYSRLWAFKFQSSNHVFFHCKIRFCPAGSQYCNINCDSRKKRSPELADGTVYGTASRVLQVDPAEEYISSSTKSRIQQDVAIAGAVTLIIWLVKTLFI